MNFDGIFTPIVTPYKEDFKIDINNLEKTLNYLIRSKVHGIILGGTTGEYYAQSISCLLYTSPSPRDGLLSRMPSSA